MSKSLNDTMTRYEFLQELKDDWAGGLEVLKHMKPGYVTKADVTMMETLKVAIMLLEKKLDLASDYDAKKFDLRRTVDDIPKHAEDIELLPHELEQRRQRTLDKLEEDYGSTKT